MVKLRAISDQDLTLAEENIEQLMEKHEKFKSTGQIEGLVKMMDLS